MFPTYTAENVFVRALTTQFKKDNPIFFKWIENLENSEKKIHKQTRGKKPSTFHHQVNKI